jgi:putative endonuclease
MAEHNVLGKDGETAAIAYLKENGYQILHTNWHRGYLELDIVAKTDDELVVIEVKTRSGGTITNPEDAVTDQKIRHIISATDFYIKFFNIDLPVRFDIISVIGKYPDFEIDHIEDAFYPPVNVRRW